MKWKAAFCLISTLFALAACEFLARVFIFDPNNHYLRTPGWRISVINDHRLPNVTGDVQLKVNRYGYLGQAPSPLANPKIGFWGGSTVEDFVLNYEETSSYQIQEKLKVCGGSPHVSNLGKAGVNIRHHLIQMEGTLSYMPKFDVHIVLLGLNDMLYDYRIHHNFETREDWWHEQSFMYTKHTEGKWALIALARRLLANTNSEKRVSNLGAYIETLREARREAKITAWVDELPNNEENLQKYKENVLALKAFAEQQAAAIFFVTQPYLWADEMPEESISMLYAGYIGPTHQGSNVRRYTPKALAKALDGYNDALRDVCLEYSLNCIDIAAKFPKSPELFYDDFHFSEAGAKLVAEIIGTELIDTPQVCNDLGTPNTNSVAKN